MQRKLNDPGLKVSGFKKIRDLGVGATATVELVEITLIKVDANGKPDATQKPLVILCAAKAPINIKSSTDATSNKYQEEGGDTSLFGFFLPADEVDKADKAGSKPAPSKEKTILTWLERAAQGTETGVISCIGEYRESIFDNTGTKSYVLFPVCQTTLEAEMRRIDQLDETRLEEKRIFRAKVAFELIHALFTLEYNGVIHNDIKLDNVLIRNGECRLVDFGSAKALNEELSAQLAKLPTNFAEDDTHFVGSPEYTAPEVLYDGEPSFKSDVWSVGEILRKLLGLNTKMSVAIQQQDAQGKPTLARGTGAILHYKEIAKTLRSQQSARAEPLTPLSSALAACATFDEAFICLAERMTMISPDERPDAKELERGCEILYSKLLKDCPSLCAQEQSIKPPSHPGRPPHPTRTDPQPLPGRHPSASPAENCPPAPILRTKGSTPAEPQKPQGLPERHTRGRARFTNQMGNGKKDPGASPTDGHRTPERK
ncbi:MAG: hypothetical protein A3J38_06115 [Gammaproteobacteria bacterium RIFCSPHIGHO2_12_FULL_45_9]|nr:MAG: hypothetical protein A3J38_06115 [Gammaproteobacteria bacterium RIFCSPHIGHO2_12_FULL_45_9]